MLVKVVYCYYYLLKSFGGDDKFDNLRIIYKDIYFLIYIINKMIIDYYVNELKLLLE